MTDFQTLYAAVLASPADETPRLGFADYLDDNGRCEWAEFIRLQCTRVTRRHLTDCESLDFNLRRERDLLGRHFRDWIGFPIHELHPGDWWASFGVQHTNPAILFFDTQGVDWDYINDPEGGSICYCRWEFRFGFITHVHCHQAHWERHGRTLCEREPIAGVEFTHPVTDVDLRRFQAEQPRVRTWTTPDQPGLNPPLEQTVIWGLEIVHPAEWTATLGGSRTEGRLTGTFPPTNYFQRGQVIGPLAASSRDGTRWQIPRAVVRDVSHDAGRGYVVSTAVEAVPDGQITRQDNNP